MISHLLPSSRLVQEYRRASHTLSSVPGPLALFLRLYSLYLAGEKQKE